MMAASLPDVRRGHHVSDLRAVDQYGTPSDLPGDYAYGSARAGSPRASPEPMRSLSAFRPPVAKEIGHRCLGCLVPFIDLGTVALPGS